MEPALPGWNQTKACQRCEWTGSAPVGQSEWMTWVHGHIIGLKTGRVDEKTSHASPMGVCMRHGAGEGGEIGPGVAATGTSDGGQNR